MKPRPLPAPPALLPATHTAAWRAPDPAEHRGTRCLPPRCPARTPNLCQKPDSTAFLQHFSSFLYASIERFPMPGESAALPLRFGSACLWMLPGGSRTPAARSPPGPHSRSHAEAHGRDTFGEQRGQGASSGNKNEVSFRRASQARGNLDLQSSTAMPRQQPSCVPPTRQPF